MTTQQTAPQSSGWEAYCAAARAMAAKSEPRKDIRDDRNR